MLCILFGCGPWSVRVQKQEQCHRKTFFLIVSNEAKSLEMCLITLYFQLNILRKMVGSSSQCIWISWPDHMPFAAFQWKNDKCPCRRWAHLTWDLMECEKITVSYLSLNKHIYEMHTSLNCPLWFYGFLWDYKSGRFQCWMDLAIWGGGGGIHKILKGWPGHLQGLWYWEFF